MNAIPPDKSSSKGRKSLAPEVDAGLLEEARRLGIDLTSACEEGLAAAIERESVRRWRSANADAVAASNAYVEQHGLPLAAARRF